MTSILATLRQEYTNSFSREVPIRAAQGFIVGTGLNLLAGCEVEVAVIGGSIAAAATLIEAAVRPIINTILPHSSTAAKILQFVIPKAAALGLGLAIAPWFGVSLKISAVMLSFAAWITLTNFIFAPNNNQDQV